MIFEIINNSRELIDHAIDFFTAEDTDTEKFEEIKKICGEQAKLKRPNDVEVIAAGLLSPSDFFAYIFEKRIVEGPLQLSRALNVLLDAMVEHGMLSKLPSWQQFNFFNSRYKSTGKRTKFLYDRGLILNVVCGWQFIVERYKDSVVKIQNKSSNGECAIGTGFYHAINLTSGGVLYLVITNYHVLENAQEIMLFNRKDEVIQFKEYFSHAKKDLAFIVLNESLDSPIFHFNITKEILSEIITIGYPSVPMTNNSYQLCHRGEINSFVEDYQSNQLILFSAKTSSGNSGSPIIDRYGMVVGLVTEELFEKHSFYEKGKLPYYAGIPSEEIVRAIEENVKLT